MVQCQVCGRDLPAEQIFICPNCGLFVCENCAIKSIMGYHCPSCGGLLELRHIRPITGITYPYGHKSNKITFSRKEIVHITIAMAALTFAFWFRPEFLQNPLSTVRIRPLLIIFPGLLTGFLFHEFGHKISAQKLGYWAEFRLFPLGILLILFSAFTGLFIIAAPGAVVIYGLNVGIYEREKRNYGVISAAGPAVNILMFLIFLLITPFSVGLLRWIGIYGCKINASLALFNLIPFWILDGAKIFKWNSKVWALMFIISILELYVSNGLVMYHSSFV